MRELEERIRLGIYQHFVREGRALTPDDLATGYDISTRAAKAALGWLATEAEALVLIPGTSYVWMAEPFSAVPTDFPVRSGDSLWYGNCVWDALAILALTKRDGFVETLCPHSSERLRLTVVDGDLQPSGCAVHFAVAARDWWKDIGFT